MAHYCVTFRIAEKPAAGLSAAERRQRLIDNVYTKGGGFWDEPTSFIFAESALDTYQFGGKAVEGLSRRDDLVLIFDPEDMSACYFGPIEDEAVLLSFLPGAKKL